MITAQHTHSAPAGYHTYWMFQTAAGGGFVNETFQVYVSSIVEVIILNDFFFNLLFYFISNI